jgi:amidophosphoribosyltransferase
MGADSVGFLSLEDTKKMATGICKDYCVGCFSGEYPINISKALQKDKFEEKIHEVK